MCTTTWVGALRGSLACHAHCLAPACSELPALDALVAHLYRLYLQLGGREGGPGLRLPSVHHALRLPPPAFGITTRALLPTTLQARMETCSRMWILAMGTTPLTPQAALPLVSRSWIPLATQGDVELGCVHECMHSWQLGGTCVRSTAVLKLLCAGLPDPCRTVWHFLEPESHSHTAALAAASQPAAALATAALAEPAAPATALPFPAAPATPAFTKPATPASPVSFPAAPALPSTPSAPPLSATAKPTWAVPASLPPASRPSALAAAPLASPSQPLAFASAPQPLTYPVATKPALAAAANPSLTRLAGLAGCVMLPAACSTEGSTVCTQPGCQSFQPDQKGA